MQGVQGVMAAWRSWSGSGGVRGDRPPHCGVLIGGQVEEPVGVEGGELDGAAGGYQVHGDVPGGQLPGVVDEFLGAAPFVDAVGLPDAATASRGSGFTPTEQLEIYVTSYPIDVLSDSPPDIRSQGGGSG